MEIPAIPDKVDSDVLREGVGTVRSTRTLDLQQDRLVMEGHLQVITALIILIIVLISAK